MGGFYLMFLSLCIFAFLYTSAQPSFNLPSKDNVLKEHEHDHGYLGLQQKAIPKSDMIIMTRMLKNIMHERPGENIQTSPVGALAGLLMVHLGAGEKTRQEVLKVLGLDGKDSDSTQLHKSFDEILDKMEAKQHPHNPIMMSEDKTEATITNGFFVQKSHPVAESYVQSLHHYYTFANATNFDFLGDSTVATDHINSWISERTHNRVGKFFESPVPPHTTAILTSTVYFHGLWQHNFMEKYTKTGKFHTGSAEIEVPVMHNQATVMYISSNILQFDAIELLFRGGEYAMILSQPRPSQTIQNLTEHLHLFDVKEINRNTKLVEVDYKIPKMKLFRKQSLVNALGLKEIFETADLSPMVAHSVPISDMVQVTEIEVDEHGVTPNGMPMDSGVHHHVLTPAPGSAAVKFHIERPYYASILHRPTHMIIFNSVIYHPVH